MTRKLLGFALFAIVFVLSAAPVAAGQAAAAIEPLSPAPVACGGAALPSLAEPANVSVRPASTAPDFMVQPAARLGYCHCGCSSVRTCRTSADCGGASCDQAISGC
jgi:hypothetical protein